MSARLLVIIGEVALSFSIKSHAHRIKVVYHELEDGGFVELRGTYRMKTGDVPLIETIRRALPEVPSYL